MIDIFSKRVTLIGIVLFVHDLISVWFTWNHYVQTVSNKYGNKADKHLKPKITYTEDKIAYHFVMFIQ